MVGEPPEVTAVMHQSFDEPLEASERHERARRCPHCPCYRTEHQPRRAGDGECCDCGARNPDLETTR